MKKIVLFIVVFVFSKAVFLSAAPGGFYIELGAGYNFDENVGLGFLAKSQGAYVGAGAGLTLRLGSGWSGSLGVNMDFLIKPEITFTRGEEHYQVENIGDGASLRLLPYLQLSRSINEMLFIGFGVGYGYNNIYFGMRPLQYDSEYTSYQLSNNSVTPMLFVRIYPLNAIYLSFNYEVDIVQNGEIKVLSGDPFSGYEKGKSEINGVHHRARVVIGYYLGG